ncbi:MAG: hypothetical protein JW395_1008 [Nitrospira sp.]|nr:hypothetical protein [Nitrospira sp.]
MLALGGCSVRQAALNHIGDAIAQGSGSFFADDNPELIRAAAPFGLMLIESLIAENLAHKGLLRSFTRYAHAFVQQAAKEHEQAKAVQLRDREHLLIATRLRLARPCAGQAGLRAPAPRRALRGTGTVYLIQIAAK